MPVTISTANRGERYTLVLDEAGISTPNYCLIEKLRVTFGLEISELSNPAQDASGIDLVATLEAVRHAIARVGLHFRVEDTVHLAILLQLILHLSNHEAGPHPFSPQNLNRAVDNCGLSDSNSPRT